MDIRVIAVDIDGTLLNSKHQLSDKTKNALIAVQKNGIQLILASGRPTRSLEMIAEQLEMNKHHGLLVSYNGSIVTDCETNEILYKKLIPFETVREVIKHLKHFEVGVMIDKDNTMYAERYENENIYVNGVLRNIVEMEANLSNFTLKRVEDLEQIANFPVPKILSFGYPAYLKEHALHFKKPFESTLNSMFTIDFYYEFTPKGNDKGNALSHALEKINLLPKQLMAFGDNQNDLSMIEYAGIGIAMGNAVPKIKAKANEITASNDEDGIEKILKKKLLY